MKKINRFRKEYWFLSNFFRCYIMYCGKEWKTSEHLFQSMKTTNANMKEKMRKIPKPNRVKAFGNTIKLVPGWDAVKLGVMKRVLYLKFEQNLSLTRKLLATKDAILEEGNTWHDNYWGNCCCSRCENIKGENHLGLLLMELREELK